MRKGKQHSAVERTQPLNPETLDLNILRNDPPLIELVSFDDWTILTIDGQEVLSQHSISVSHFLSAMGIAFKQTAGQEDGESLEDYHERVHGEDRTEVKALQRQV